MAAVHLNMEEFEKMVIQEGKPALIDFWAPWCVYCRRINAAYDQIARENPDILVAKINIDDHPALAENYGVELVPTLMVFNKSEELERVVAPGSKAQIQEFLKQNLEV
jgi:thioredoxin 1